MPPHACRWSGCTTSATHSPRRAVPSPWAGALEAIVRGLEAAEPLPGRLEPVAAGTHFPVFVDYAHTPDALEQVLLALREVGEQRRLVVVFGCGGDRDPGKRAPMGEVVGRLADVPIVTSDNPRSEDPQAIIDAILDGVRASGNPRALAIADRREAIAAALSLADERCRGAGRRQGARDRADLRRPERPLRRSRRDPGACPAEGGVMRRSVAELATLLGARLDGDGDQAS